MLSSLRRPWDVNKLTSKLFLKNRNFIEGLLKIQTGRTLKEFWWYSLIDVLRDCYFKILLTTLFLSCKLIVPKENWFPINKISKTGYFHIKSYSVNMTNTREYLGDILQLSWIFLCIQILYVRKQNLMVGLS